jgi:glutathione S-transferase
MRLYHVPGTRSNRVLWALEEANAAYELETLTREQRHEPAHLERHPLGKSPAAKLAGGYVWESAGLVMQVADENPDAGLIAAPGTHDRALTYQWILFAVTEMEPGVVEKYIHKDSDAARAAHGTESYRKAAAVVEKHLGSNEYMVGGKFSVADIIMGGTLGFGAFLEMNDGFPNIGAYLGRIMSRPAAVKANS